MQRKLPVVVAALFVAFSSASSWITLAQPIAEAAKAEGVVGGTVFPLDGGLDPGEDTGTAWLSVCNIPKTGPGSLAHLDIDFRDAAGTAVGTQEVRVPAKECVTRELEMANGPDAAFAEVFNQAGLPVIVSMTANPDGTGVGGAFPVPPPARGQPLWDGPGALDDDLAICNQGSGSARFDTFGFDAKGKRTDDFARTDEVPPGTCAWTNLGAPFVGNPQPWVVAETFSTESVAPSTWTFVGSTDGDTGGDSRQPIPGNDGAQQSDRLYGPANAFPTRSFFWSDGPGETEVRWDIRNVAGKLLVRGETTLPPDGSWDVGRGADESILISSQTGQSMFGHDGREDESGSLRETDVEAARGPFVDAYVLAGEPATKRAIAFGALSSEDSIVNVIVQNVGAKKTKVKLIVHRGDGTKAFGKNLKLKGHATARVKYKKKARGNDLWAEIKVRGKGSVVLWLERIDASGDRTIYPGVTLR